MILGMKSLPSERPATPNIFYIDFGMVYLVDFFYYDVLFFFKKKNGNDSTLISRLT